jgi:AbiU2
MKIEIRSGGELTKLLDELGAEIVDAHITFKLLSDLLEARREFKIVFNQSIAFWGTTFRALLNSYLSTLCRVYDGNKKGLNLRNLLETIYANRSLFGEDQFRERLRGNAFVDSLASTNRVPSCSELEEDLKLVRERDPLVRKLLVWRNNAVAHKNAMVALGTSDILISANMSREDVEELLGRALRLFNKYSSLYRASTNSRQIIGHDDYLSLLKLAEAGILLLRFHPNREDGRRRGARGAIEDAEACDGPRNGLEIESSWRLGTRRRSPIHPRIGPPQERWTHPSLLLGLGRHL